MSILRKLRRAIRGEVSPHAAVREAFRRGQFSVRQNRERKNLDRKSTEPVSLSKEFQAKNPSALLEHFQHRSQPHFFSGFAPTSHALTGVQLEFFPEDTAALLECVAQPDNQSLNWHRDPLSGLEWPLAFHADINLHRNDGSDVRLLWELNRLGHCVTLARAYCVTAERRLSAAFFQQVESWAAGNPLGYGVNWNCAMEVALRAMNLLGAFEVFRQTPDLNEERLTLLLRTFGQHGNFIREHLEFSYVGTSNHYLSDVVGLLWLGIMLPELEAAPGWRKFGLREMLREMDKQVLDDGADFESSTGYHRFVLELILYSFVLCRANGIEIEEHYWNKLHLMLKYLRGYLRPDGYAPLIGDSDSGQVFPILKRRADDHGYLLALGAELFDDGSLKTEAVAPPELLWIFGEQALAKYQARAVEKGQRSQAFPDAGIYIMRARDLYLCFNASGTGINGRGSHGHNDALSIELSAFGRPFLVDPGSYVYTADLHERHLFRSTAYHSTIQIDDSEQNITLEETPFVIGNEAKPVVLAWSHDSATDKVSAEHYGYQRLLPPITHRRTVTFNKQEGFWLIEDELLGSGKHKLATRFHFDSGVEVGIEEGWVKGSDSSGHGLFICPLDLPERPELESQYTSRDYGEKMDSISACWTIQGVVPAKIRWALIPVRAAEEAIERLRSIRTLFEVDKDAR